MTESRRVRIAPDLKGKVAMAALSEQSRTAELAQANNVHPSQMAAWKRQGRAALEAAVYAWWADA